MSNEKKVTPHDMAEIMLALVEDCVADLQTARREGDAVGVLRAEDLGELAMRLARQYAGEGGGNNLSF